MLEGMEIQGGRGSMGRKNKTTIIAQSIKYTLKKRNIASLNRYTKMHNNSKYSYKIEQKILSSML